MRNPLSRGIYGFCVLAAVGVGACSRIFETAPEVHVRPLAQKLNQPDAADSGYYQSAASAIESRDYATALDYLQAAREKQPNDVRILNAFGVVYDKLERFDLSARYYAQASALEPNSRIVAKNIEYSKILQGLVDPPQLPQVALAQPQVLPSNVASDPVFSLPAPVPAVPKISANGIFTTKGGEALDVSTTPTNTAVPSFVSSVPADTANTATVGLTLAVAKPNPFRVVEKSFHPSQVALDLEVPQLITPPVASQVMAENYGPNAAPIFQLPISANFMLVGPIEASALQPAANPIAVKFAQVGVRPSQIVPDLARPLLVMPDLVSMNIIDKVEPAVPSLPAQTESSSLLTAPAILMPFAVKPLAVRVAARRIRPSGSDLDLAIPRLPVRQIVIANTAEKSKDANPDTRAPIVAQPRQKQGSAIENHFALNTTTTGVPRAIHSLPEFSKLTPKLKTAAVVSAPVLANRPAPSIAGLTGYALVVVDASGKGSAIEPVRQRLTSLGWTLSRSSSPNLRAQPYTTISYPHSSLVAARALARTLPFSVRVTEITCHCGVQLTLGSDYQGWRLFRNSVPRRIGNGLSLAALLPGQTRGGIDGAH